MYPRPCSDEVLYWNKASQSADPFRSLAKLAETHCFPTDRSQPWAFCRFQMISTHPHVHRFNQTSTNEEGKTHRRWHRAADPHGDAEPFDGPRRAEGCAWLGGRMFCRLESGF